jgi:hypothetical protein
MCDLVTSRRSAQGVRTELTSVEEGDSLWETNVAPRFGTTDAK